MMEVELEALEELEEALRERLCGDGFDAAGTCRSCLATGGHVRSLEASEADGVWECAQVRIESGDGLPQGLCPSCREDLARAHAFRSRCRRSDALLRRVNMRAEPLKIECDVKLEIDDEALFDNQTAHSVDSDDEKQKETKVSRKRKKYKCNVCGRPLCSKASLEQHMRKVHDDGRKGSDEGISGCRITGWGKERRFNCVECSYSTPYRTSFVYHVRVHTGEKPFKCDVCGSRFTQPGSLNVHRRVHSDETYYTCAVCGKQFKHKRAYENHKLVHDESNRFVCDICQKVLRSKKTLIGHLNRHYNIKNFACETCGGLFVTQVELLNHSRIHNTEKRFFCHLCSFVSHLKTSLEQHLVRHTGNRPFGCDQCEVSCYTRGELKCHRRKHTKEKNYSCPVCEVKFVQSCSVNTHMKEIHGMKYTRETVDRRTVK